MLKIETRLEKFVSLGTFWEESEPLLERIGSRCNLEHGCTQVWDRFEASILLALSLTHSLTLSLFLLISHTPSRTFSEFKCTIEQVFAHVKHIKKRLA